MSKNMKTVKTTKKHSSAGVWIVSILGVLLITAVGLVGWRSKGFTDWSKENFFITETTPENQPEEETPNVDEVVKTEHIIDKE